MEPARTDCRRRLKEAMHRLRARVREREQPPPKLCGECQERYRLLVQHAFDGALLLDEAGSRVIDASAPFLALLGHASKDAIAGLSLNDILFDQRESLPLAALVGARTEVRFARKDGTTLDAEVRGVRFPAGDGATICLTVQDVTERKLLERSLRHEATHDHLTGLPNRRHFTSRIQQEIAYHQRRQKTLAVMVLDLDNFKQVNDTLGHRSGDALLREFAHRLRMTVREYDVVARFGGDEFQIGLIDVGSRENVAYVARKLLDLFATPFRAEGNRVDYVSGSIGIALYPGDGNNAETLFTSADSALYESKRKGKGRFSFYCDAPIPIVPPRSYDTPERAPDGSRPQSD